MKNKGNKVPLYKKSTNQFNEIYAGINSSFSVIFILLNFLFHTINC